MNTNLLCRWSMAIAAAFFGGGSAVHPAMAVTTYSYVGNAFTAATPDVDPPSGSYAIGPAGDSFTGFVSLAGPLGSNLFYYDALPLIETFSFSDGRSTWSTTTRGVIFTFVISTDDVGKIINWNVQVGDPFCNINVPWTCDGPRMGNVTSFNYSFLGIYDQAQVQECTVFNGNICTLIPGEAAWNINAPGTWTRSTSLSEVPMPAALPLFASGLGVMGIFGWRRKKKGAVLAAA